MKIMIVDDEPLMREGIIKKIRMTGLPVTIAAEAANGEEALEKLLAVRPDLVLTDIRMPRMDGLSFLQQAVKQAVHEPQYIVISGYGEFDYARKAIQYGVTDFLLKPVDREELKESLQRGMEKLKRRRQQDLLGERFRHLQDHTEESLRQQTLSKFIQHGSEDGGSAGAQDKKLLEMEKRCRYFAAVVLDLEPFRLPHLSFRQEDEKLFWFAVKNIVSTILESTGREGVPFRHVLHERELVYVLGGREPFEAEALERELLDILEGIVRHLKLRATIGCGGTVERMDGVQQSYLQAKHALRNKLLHGADRVYMADTAPVAADPRSILSGEDEVFLLRCLNDCNTASLDSWIEKRVEALACGEPATYANLEIFCVEFHLLLRKYLLTQTRIPEWMIGELDDLLSWLQGLRDWREIPRQLQGTVHNIVGRLFQLRHSSEYNVIDEVKRYIDSSLHEPLSLQLIAERFFFHPSYFSRKFKERFGESFVNYLTSARIRKSEKLLRDPALKVQEVAELVGFKDAAYFSSVFRKSTGMTPVQFRQLDIHPGES